MDGYNMPPVYGGGIQGYQRRVSFGEAVNRGLNNYATFSGRASRSEFWWWALFTFIVGLAASILDAMIGIEIFSTIVALGLLIPNLAIAWRRLHDIGRAGGWYFIGLIPLVGWIILLIWDLKESEYFDNRFGSIPNWVNN